MRGGERDRESGRVPKRERNAQRNGPKAGGRAVRERGRERAALLRSCLAAEQRQR